MIYREHEPEPFQTAGEGEGDATPTPEQWFAEIQRDHHVKHIRFGIHLADGTLIGDVALQDLDWQAGTCELGMGLTKQSYRGQGYGGRAALLILAHAFQELGLKKITARTLDVNVPAKRVLERLGMRPEAKPDELTGKVAYAITAEKFRLAHGNVETAGMVK